VDTLVLLDQVLDLDLDDHHRHKRLELNRLAERPDNEILAVVK